MYYHNLPKTDSEAFELLSKEAIRQDNVLELIPSENYVSQAVLEALGSLFNNKYAEGTPGRRYYGGQTYTDKMEEMGIARAKALFSADHANLQVLSGAAANLAVYSAWLDIGDKILGMDLSHGGHLTHGAPVTFAAKAFRFAHYKISDVSTGKIDYDALEKQALEEKPKILLAGFSAYSRKLDYRRFAKIAEKVGALAMADMSHIGGLIAGKVAENPLELGFHVMTTTTHKSLRGPRGAMILSRGVVSNPLKKPAKTLENIPTLIDRAVFPGLQGGPHMNKMLAICVALKEAAQPEFHTYAQKVLDNAQALAKRLQERGAELVSGGTDNHLMLMNTHKNFQLTGAEAQNRLEEAGITVNKNTIPEDPLPFFQTSGIRLGTPCATSRGMGEEQMQQIGDWLVDTCSGKRKPQEVLEEVKAMCKNFPSPSGLVYQR